MSSETVRAILGPMRLPFLLLPPACVALGVATAYWTGAELDVLTVLLALVGAVAAHVSVNALNEYHDFQSGLDLKTRKTPFSGGSGTLPDLPGKARYALVTGVLAALLTALIGLYFFSVRGWQILPLGLAGLLVIVLYTRIITRSPTLCLVAPGLGFGILMVMGTDFVLSGSYSTTAFLASLVPFFLVSNLLLLNQLPDIGPDREVGRHHLPIAAGAGAAVRIYGLFLLATYLVIVIGILLRYLPWWGLLGLGTAAMAIPTFMGARRHAEDIPLLTPYLARNVLVVIATPLLLAVGLFIAGQRG